MPTRDDAIAKGRLPVTRSRLVRDLQALGVQPGDVLMVHTRLSALGWVVGGSGTVVQALLDVLGPGGTLMAYAGWEDDFKYEVDYDRKTVTVTAPGAPPRTAKYNGDQGSTILPVGEKDVFLPTLTCVV